MSTVTLIGVIEVTSEYDYALPSELIAQHPLENRADARLMVVNRANGSIEHFHIRDLPEILSAGDLLVLNNSKVIPAKLVGKRTKTGGRWRGLFLESDEDGVWRILGKTRGKIEAGERITLEDGDGRLTVQLRLIARMENGQWAAKPESRDSVEEILARVGRVPLPHYIRSGEMLPGDVQRYQTIFADEPGSIAAPTAGLHFTPLVLERLLQEGVEQAFVTLHVGIGTFRPVSSERLDEHVMHTERGELSTAMAAKIEKTRSAGGRVIAVGTTSVRVLETAAGAADGTGAWMGNTDLFIRPPYEFRAVDALLTNFHFPKSTLLVLVRTFGGSELLKRAYEEAIAEEYRFFSYGDAMLIL